MLEELGITPFKPKSVRQYKRKKVAAVMEEIQNRHSLMQEVILAYWERQVLGWLKPDLALHPQADDIFRVKFFDVGVARMAVTCAGRRSP